MSQTAADAKSRMMSGATRIIRLLWGLFPLRPTGIVVLAAAAGALGPGLIHRDHVLLVAAVAGFVLVLLAVLVTIFGAAWCYYRVQPAHAPVRLVVGVWRETGFYLRTPFWFPLLDLRWAVRSPDVEVRLEQRGATTYELWAPRRRGRPTTTERLFTVGDAFGIASITIPISVPQELSFSPSEGALRNVQVVRGLASGSEIPHPEGRAEGDLQDMRSYGAGDPIRYVLWKVFARSRELVVRAPERALSPVTRTAAFLIAGPGDQAAAGTAKTAVECGALGSEWAFGADGCEGAATERREAVEMIVRSGDTPAAGSAQGLKRFLATKEANDPRRVVVFAGAHGGAWVSEVLAVAAHTRIELILCADRVTDPESGRRMHTFFFRPEPLHGPGLVVVSRTELAELCRGLSGVGEIRVVDRQAGQVYGAVHLSKLVGAA